MSKGKQPGSNPDHAMRVPTSMLEQLADPNADIPGVDNDGERDRVLAGVRHGSRHVMTGGHVVINGAPVERPTLSDEVTALLARSDKDKGKGGNGRG